MHYVSGYFSMRFIRIMLFIFNIIMLFLPIVIQGDFIWRIWPNVMVASVFFWSLMAPNWFSSGYIALFGLIYDGIYVMPMGMMSILLLTLRWTILTQRQYLMAQPFIIQWLAFTVYMALLCWVQWGYMSIFRGQSLVTGPVILAWVMSVLTYPFLHQLFLLLYNKVKPSIRQYKNQQ